MRTIPSLTIIGDIGIDLVLGPIESWPKMGTESVVEQSELRAGGSAGNTALAVSYLGAQSRLLSLVGNDDFGAWLSAQLGSLDVSLPTCDAATSLSIGFIHSCGERTFFTTRGHLEHLAYEHVAPLLRPASHARSIVMLCGVFLTPRLRASYSRLIDEIAGLGYEIALDTGWPPGGWNEPVRDEVAHWVSKSDHLLLNELEIASLADHEDLESALPSVTQLLKPGASLVVKTGARGAFGIQSGRRFEGRASQFAVFDTVGAGDSFNAGYLLSRLEGGGLADALNAGCKAAASIISRFPRRQIKAGELANRMALPLAMGARQP
jgi:sugar/nucleoside kinase (ribokinase family)